MLLAHIIEWELNVAVHILRLEAVAEVVLALVLLPWEVEVAPVEGLAVQAVVAGVGDNDSDFLL